MPGLPTSDEPPREMHLCGSSSTNAARLPSFLDMRQNPTFCSLLAGCAIPCTRNRETTSERPKVFRSGPVSFALLTSKYASRHNGVHFSTSQLPKLLRTLQFLTLLTSKRALRHKRALFVRTRNVLPTKAACTFSTSQLPKVLRT